MRLSRVIVLLLTLLVSVPLALAEGPAVDPSMGVVRSTIGKFKSTLALAPPDFPDTSAPPLSTSRTEYAGPNRSKVWVETFRFRQDAQAYEFLSLLAATARTSNGNIEILSPIGTAGFASANEIVFFKGSYVVIVKNVNGRPADLNELALGWAEAIDKGEGDIPVLIRHLPAPDQVHTNAVYLSNFADLHRLPFRNAVYDAVQSGGNADAAFATYGPSKVLLIEFHTPQLAADNDRRIIARIHELWKLGQPAPTAYKRVGNYSVFVFDAPDEQTAKELISQVKYEQVVQWLGENPNILKEAEKRYINTTLGVLIAVLKASGYALIACLGIGGLIGGLLFSYRRAQQKTVTFSDAGGMLRLNLDELTAETDPSRLLRERN